MTDTSIPSRLSIAFSMLATGSALISTAWIGAGLWSEREAAGFVLGLVASLLLMVGTIGRIIGREEMLRQARREKNQQVGGRAEVPPAVFAAQRMTQEFSRFVPAVPQDGTVRLGGPGYASQGAPTEVIKNWPGSIANRAGPAPDETARLYPESQCPTEIIRLGPFDDVERMQGWMGQGPSSIKRSE